MLLSKNQKTRQMTASTAEEKQSDSRMMTRSRRTPPEQKQTRTAYTRYCFGVFQAMHLHQFYTVDKWFIARFVLLPLFAIFKWCCRLFAPFYSIIEKKKP